ncbi:hypothetical protein B0H10DRAFT_1951028 [Mycena sp. CBHHK59/15]|nr:hypothetical protein B0H10DRAFT_1951028 [Mycena sp. CBHHK59/15]
MENGVWRAWLLASTTKHGCAWDDLPGHRAKMSVQAPPAPAHHKSLHLHDQNTTRNAPSPLPPSPPPPALTLIHQHTSERPEHDGGHDKQGTTKSCTMRTKPPWRTLHSPCPPYCVGTRTAPVLGLDATHDEQHARSSCVHAGTPCTVTQCREEGIGGSNLNKGWRGGEQNVFFPPHAPAVQRILGPHNEGHHAVTRVAQFKEDSQKGEWAQLHHIKADPSLAHAVLATAFLHVGRAGGHATTSSKGTQQWRCAAWPSQCRGGRVRGVAGGFPGACPLRTPVPAFSQRAATSRERGTLRLLGPDNRWWAPWWPWRGNEEDTTSMVQKISGSATDTVKLCISPQAKQNPSWAIYGLAGFIVISPAPVGRIKIHWVPTHVGITGNKAINTCTKKAALGTSTPLSSCIMLFFKVALPTCKATTIADGVKAFTMHWHTEWSMSPRHSHISTLDSTHPSKATEKMPGWK